MGCNIYAVYVFSLVEYPPWFRTQVPLVNVHSPAVCACGSVRVATVSRDDRGATGARRRFAGYGVP